jgi:hypothetical protein
LWCLEPADGYIKCVDNLKRGTDILDCWSHHDTRSLRTISKLVDFKAGVAFRLSCRC